MDPGSTSFHKHPLATLPPIPSDRFAMGLAKKNGTITKNKANKNYNIIRFSIKLQYELGVTVSVTAK